MPPSFADRRDVRGADRIVQPAPARRFPDRLKLPLSFDAAALAAELEGLGEEDWTAHFVRQNYEGAWSATPLRAPAGERHQIRMIYPDPGATAFVDTRWLQARPAFQALLATFGCPLRNVRLMRLGPGSTIKEHDDPGLSFEEGGVRLHVPVTSNADVSFEVNRVPVPMRPGELWYVRLADPHRVFNRGQTERVHLVIDADVHPWLEALFEQAAAA